MFFRTRSHHTKTTDKQVSVIIKRQVPIRFEETAQSWLGGLPMMPLLTKWPRDKAGAPLHFVAQIACADLPAKLWNGLGPRKGWLLLFVETLKLEDHADSGLVQVIHTTSLGREREPPKDAPTVRHTMSDYIDYAAPTIRPGVPKLWRKWPVDLVVQEYHLGDADDVRGGPPDVPAEDLYDGPVSDKGIVQDAFELDRPLTWRGALYVIEGLHRDLKPGDFKRRFIGNGGLINPPEPDQTASDTALAGRLGAEVKAERRTGWMLRAFPAIEVVKARLEHWRDTYQRELDEGRETLGSAKLNDLKGRIKYQIDALEKLEEDRAYLDGLLRAYPGEEGEAAFNAEIKALGEAHLAWGAQLGSAVERLLGQILSQNLDAALPDEEWRKIVAAVKDTRSTFWERTFDTRVLRKVEKDLSFRGHLRMAVREDLLDLYTRSKDACFALPAELFADLEQRLRYVEVGLPHRMGGQANPVQGEDDASTLLLFQIASDRALGWMWGDVGALYVKISADDLRRNRLDRLEAWIEGH